MSVDVSVVVPVYNPGPNLADCIDSLLGQTLPRERFEAIFVDDGSTDGSGQLLDDLAAAHPGLIRVAHIPNSGWPGTPRNVGIDMARGRYVQLLDNDDSLAPQALESCLRVGDGSRADVVLGKIVSDFRGVKHAVFTETVTGLTVDDWRPVHTLTPHKMFRKQFLVDHGIRFPDGRVNLEDQMFCMQAYVHAESMAIVADSCYYYMKRRGAGSNAGTRLIVPQEYYGDLDRVLGVIADNVSDPGQRDRMYRRFYRVEMLGRLRGPVINGYEDDYRRGLVAEVRALAMRRFSETTHAGMPFFLRAQSRLLLDNDVDGLIRWSDEQEELDLQGEITALQWESGGLMLTLRATLHHGERPLQLDRAGADWLLPPALAASDSEAERRLARDALADAEIDLALRSRVEHSTFLITDGLAVSITADGEIVVDGTVRIDPANAMAGRPLDAGLWDVKLRLNVGGLTRILALRMAPEHPMTDRFSAWMYDAGTRRSLTAYWTNPNQELALDVDEWMHALQMTAARRAAVDGWDRDRRTLHVRLPGILGNCGEWPAALTLTPVTAGDALICPATMTPTSDGALLSVRLPVLPPSADGWTVGLTIGPAGGVPPTTLAITLPAGVD